MLTRDYLGNFVHKSKWKASARGVSADQYPNDSTKTGPWFAIDNIIQTDEAYTYIGPTNSILGEWLQVV